MGLFGWVRNLRNELFISNTLAYQDFVSHFKTLNISKVKNWDEVRIKGKFIRVQVKSFYSNHFLCFFLLSRTLKILTLKW